LVKFVFGCGCCRCLETMVSATLSSMSRASLWLTRFFLYTVILAFSIAIDGVMGKKGDNVWNTTLSYNGKIFDFCAYSASTMTATSNNLIGNSHTCMYVIALASTSFIVYFILWVLTIVDVFYRFLSKYWPGELFTNIWMVCWWLIGAIVVTSQRPSSAVENTMGISKDIKAIEALSWINFVFSLFMVIVTFVNGAIDARDRVDASFGKAEYHQPPTSEQADA
jgi:hypothetical protein